MIDYAEILGTPYGLPEWLINKLEDCPSPGGGVHSPWMPSVISALRHYVAIDECVEIVRDYMTREEGSPNEVSDSAERIYGQRCEGVARPPDPYAHLKNDAGKDPLEAQRIISAWIKRGALKTLTGSTNSIPSECNHCLNYLYREEDFICVGSPYISQKTGRNLPGYFAGTGRWKEYKTIDLGGFPLVVPNPMIAEWAYTKGTEPKRSERCEGNAAIDRRYVVMDFDFDLEGPFRGLILGVQKWGIPDPRTAIHELTASIILELALNNPKIPLAMVLDSGGKSLHAWWQVSHLSFLEQREFFYSAVPLGADWRIFDVTCQFVRMPFGTREISGVRQPVVFWGL